jgi:hypothetical protein
MHKAGLTKAHAEDSAAFSSASVTVRSKSSSVKFECVPLCLRSQFSEQGQVRCDPEGEDRHNSHLPFTRSYGNRDMPYSTIRFEVAKPCVVSFYRFLQGSQYCINDEPERHQSVRNTAYVARSYMLI